MLGTTVIISSILVPLMGGGNVEKADFINTILFVAGINTLLQTLFGTRLPVVIGASYAYIIPSISIALSSRYIVIIDPRLRFKASMRDFQGSLIVASFFTMATGFFGFLRIIGRFISPLAAIPLVILTGLGLYAQGFPQVRAPNSSFCHFSLEIVVFKLAATVLLARCIEVGLPALVAVVFLSQYVPHWMKSRRGIFERFAILFSVGIIWAFAEILTAVGAYDNRATQTQFSCRTDRSGLISAAPWIRFPYPFQWGRPRFDAGDAVAVIAASFVAIIESTGTFIAASRYASATPMPPSVLSRGAGWLGVGLLLNGLFGTGSGSTASVSFGTNKSWKSESHSNRSLFMLFFSVLGKFGAVLASIPLPIMAALYCVLFAYVASAGLGLLQFCNLNSFRTKFILGFSLFIGLSVPQYFNQYLLVSGHGPVNTGSTWYNNVMQVIFSSPATVGIMVAFFLDCTHSYGHSSVRIESGRHWWEKFRTFSTDTRTEEFYSLPANLNRGPRFEYQKLQEEETNPACNDFNIGQYPNFDDETAAAEKDVIDDNEEEVTTVNEHVEHSFCNLYNPEEEKDEEVPEEKKKKKMPQEYNWNMPELLQIPEEELVKLAIDCYTKVIRIKKDDCFDTKEDLKIALYTKCVEDGYQLKVNKSSKDRFETKYRDGRFELLFIAIGAAIRSFITCMRPVIIVDGAHLKGRYLGVNLLAVAMNANNGILPIAYGVGPISNLTIISDRANSIDNVVRRCFPDAFHGLCGVHLYINLKSRSADNNSNGLVDLNAKTCSVKKWKTSGYPYGHVIKVALHLNQDDSRTYAIYCYTTEVYRHTYAEIVYPIPYPSEWDIPNDLQTVLPPVMDNRLHGRPKNKIVYRLRVKRKGYRHVVGARKVVIQG
ncbi:Nucleobase-ascorbate transporter 4 [Hibiscus syriacus]|uniref:Nucleobase-ascorbate transporter 4 n=1 Tax=Hibiscus syriacus TaxID=106335 RepID=A0A6A2XYC5_HIBSY|nr:Nucleobase-ascorbate transporter 4 [Hibiscus syriacus]